MGAMGFSAPISVEDTVVLEAGPEVGAFLPSTCPRSREGSMMFLMRCLRTLVSGKPPSVLRFHIWCTSGATGAFCAESGEAVRRVTTKVPPVEGWRETSPRDVENVESNSWANWRCVNIFKDSECMSKVLMQRARGMKILCNAHVPI
jgi:hypothetical protein